MSTELISNISVTLSELKFDMQKFPNVDENNQVSVGIGTKIDSFKKIEIGHYSVHAVYFVYLGNEDEVEKNRKNWSEGNVKFIKNITNYFFADFNIEFDTEDSSLLDKDNNLKIPESSSRELMENAEPYFRELLANIFSRSTMSTPPIPFRFWENMYEVK